MLVLGHVGVVNDLWHLEKSELELRHQNLDLGSSFGNVRTTCFLIQAFSMERSFVVRGKGLVCLNLK